MFCTVKLIFVMYVTFGDCSYIYFSLCFSIDATHQYARLGRLINDSKANPNCKVEKLVINSRPHLCVFALKPIRIGEEIQYDYNDDEAWWRKVFICLNLISNFII